jgi:imidazolonepropionase-like amidohydrolase
MKAMRRWAGVGGILLLATGNVCAQQAKPPRKTYVLKAARMFDGKSNALLAPGLVIVTDMKIAGVGAGATIPAGAEVIELGDATLLPAFIDAHTHLTGEASDDWKQDVLDELRRRH